MSILRRDLDEASVPRHPAREDRGRANRPLLTAELATQTLAAAGRAFTDLGSLLGVLGVHGPSNDHLWVAYDEL
ncbi:MAG TPA: hypothetical protein VJ851_09405 [Jatrophihabitans sp.]|nr:hypothetical protein [Jatrophihabitans sp.]